ncbi:MAG TPA: hypothetical protein PKO22_09590 [Treponemataceae bacterium]|nr:hypothetical protein [Treponemataceae bacterium]
MILIDTFDSDVEATFLTDILKKNGIAYTQKSDASCEIYINEADEAKLNEIIKGLD